MNDEPENHHEHGAGQDHHEHGSTPDDHERGSTPDHNDHGAGQDHHEHGSTPDEHDQGSMPDHNDHGSRQNHHDHVATSPGHEHSHAGERGGRLRSLLGGVVRPHSHDASETIDSALTTSREGMRALKISLAGLALTAALQFIVVLFSHSVALFADTIHNFADALTAIPLAIAFLVGRRPPTRRYTYGFGRAEDLAGIVILATIAVSSVITAWIAIDRLVHPQSVESAGWVVVAGLVGFVGNELVAMYRIRIGRRIGSAALVADGLHARTDGLTSLAVVVGTIGVLAGWKIADPLTGLIITVAILFVLRKAARDIYRRLMDAVDPALVDRMEQEPAAITGVQSVENVRIRWIGHELRGELTITVDRDLAVADAHAIAEVVRHDLLHHIPRLADAIIHVDPSRFGGVDPHHDVAHHAGSGRRPGTRQR